MPRRRRQCERGKSSPQGAKPRLLARVGSVTDVQIKTPSGREVDLRPRFESFWSRAKSDYWFGNFGEKWLAEVHDLDNALRVLDRSALKVLDRHGAQNAIELAERLANTGRFALKPLRTNVTPEIAAAWLDFAARRRYVDPYPTGGDVVATHGRWVTSARGHEQIKHSGLTSMVSLVPKVAGFLSASLGILVALVGGATVVNQIVKENIDLFGGVAVMAAVVGLSVGLVYLAMRDFARHIERCRVASIEVMWRHHMLELPSVRPPGVSSRSSNVLQESTSLRKQPEK